MIGNPNWFTVRKWGGWGLTPRTWQGWVYIALMILPYIIVSSLPFSLQTVQTVSLVWTAFILVEVFDMMLHLKRDEREEKHEALAERNASWFLVFTLAFGTIIKSFFAKTPSELDPVVLIALGGAVIVKALTYFSLRHK